MENRFGSILCMRRCGTFHDDKCSVILNEDALREFELDCFGLIRFPLNLSLMYCREGAV